MENKRDLAMRLGGAGLCQLALGKLELKVDVNGGFPIVVSGAGWKTSLDFLVRLLPKGGNDPILQELLVLLPSLVCLDDFMKKLPVFEATPEEFEQLVNMGHVV